MFRLCLGLLTLWFSLYLHAGDTQNYSPRLKVLFKLLQTGSNLSADLSTTQTPEQSKVLQEAYFRLKPQQCISETLGEIERLLNERSEEKEEKEENDYLVLSLFHLLPFISIYSCILTIQLIENLSIDSFRGNPKLSPEWTQSWQLFQRWNKLYKRVKYRSKEKTEQLAAAWIQIQSSSFSSIQIALLTKSTLGTYQKFMQGHEDIFIELCQLFKSNLTNFYEENKETWMTGYQSYMEFYLLTQVIRPTPYTPNYGAPFKLEMRMLHLKIPPEYEQEIKLQQEKFIITLKNTLPFKSVPTKEEEMGEFFEIRNPESLSSILGLLMETLQLLNPKYKTQFQEVTDINTLYLDWRDTRDHALEPHPQTKTDKKKQWVYIPSDENPNVCDEKESKKALSCEGQPWEPLHNDAVKAFANGNLTEAECLFKEAIKSAATHEAPSNAELALNLGLLDLYMTVVFDPRFYAASPTLLDELKRVNEVFLLDQENFPSKPGTEKLLREIDHLLKGKPYFEKAVALMKTCNEFSSTDWEKLPIGSGAFVGNYFPTLLAHEPTYQPEALKKLADASIQFVNNRSTFMREIIVPNAVKGKVRTRDKKEPSEIAQLASDLIGRLRKFKKGKIQYDKGLFQSILEKNMQAVVVIPANRNPVPIPVKLPLVYPTGKPRVPISWDKILYQKSYESPL